MPATFWIFKSNGGTVQKKTKLARSASSDQLAAGGKPSTWFPPGGWRAVHILTKSLKSQIQGDRISSIQQAKLRIQEKYRKASRWILCDQKSLRGTPACLESFPSVCIAYFLLNNDNEQKNAFSKFQFQDLKMDKLGRNRIWFPRSFELKLSKNLSLASQFPGKLSILKTYGQTFQ